MILISHFNDYYKPFYKNKSGIDEVNSCEGPLTIQKCLASLKNLKNCKSLGIHGFTVEFCKIFFEMTLR
jgi:hypothetical protein